MLSQALAAVAASRAAATLPGATVAGTRIGPGVELDWGGGLVQTGPPPTPPGQARSPVDGSLVSADQARHERAQLDAGYTYDAQRDAFVYVPEKVEMLKAGPSYATLQAQQEKAARDVVRGQQRRARAQRIRTEQIHEEMAWHEQDYLRHKADFERAERVLIVLKTIEFVADVGVSTTAHFVPVIGPIIDRGYSEIKMIASSTSTGYYEGAEAGLQEYAKQRVYKVFRDRIKIPVESSSDKVVTVLLDQTFDKGQDLVINMGIDAIKDRGTQLLTGTP